MTNLVSTVYLVRFQKVRDIYGAESTQMTYARESMKALWDGLLKIADKNKDQRIQLDEWIQVLKSSDPKNQSKWLNEYLIYMFKLFDVSGIVASVLKLLSNTNRLPYCSR